VSRIPLTDSEPTVDAPIHSDDPQAPIRTSEETNSIEVPYTDYMDTTGHPYIVDHFSLGDSWDDPTGGFSKEVSTIEAYVQSKIKSGEVANSITAIKGVIKDMEKFNNLNKEERAVVKIEVLANYAEFMLKNEKTRSNVRRYLGAR
jgi:hypothetical protein